MPLPHPPLRARALAPVQAGSRPRTGYCIPARRSAADARITSTRRVLVTRRPSSLSRRSSVHQSSFISSATSSSSSPCSPHSGGGGSVIIRTEPASKPPDCRGAKIWMVPGVSTQSSCAATGVGAGRQQGWTERACRPLRTSRDVAPPTQMVTDGHRRSQTIPDGYVVTATGWLQTEWRSCNWRWAIE